MQLHFILCNAYLYNNNILTHVLAHQLIITNDVVISMKLLANLIFMGAQDRTIFSYSFLLALFRSETLHNRFRQSFEPRFTYPESVPIVKIELNDAVAKVGNTPFPKCLNNSDLSEIDKYVPNMFPKEMVTKTAGRITSR